MCVQYILLFAHLLTLTVDLICIGNQLLNPVIVSLGVQRGFRDFITLKLGYKLPVHKSYPTLIL